MNARERNQLSDLLGAIVEGLERDDLAGAVAVWLAVARGQVRPTDRVPPIVPSRVPGPDERRMLAVRLAGEQGAVTSRELAAATGTSQECARCDLAGLAGDGLLAASGAQRGRVYKTRGGVR